ncbi:hypothetical protein LTR56_024193 [Elasticomyces elasticus]|nr:hypothetical protein LTR56_024193 [Elasticomyces elasticus]KAK3640586.1 hypothetical protein LTR22_016962 [Elasticomyces elasticus]KAK4910218.1 hypothetical protein LTR49_021109 [Elasticomyces elasticus]KAK5759952.1 hypothetical protein LTS12_009848 [Elasticomyces elasticus]
MSEPSRLIEMPLEHSVKDETKFRLESNGPTTFATFSLVTHLATFTFKEILECMDTFDAHIFNTESQVKIEIETNHLDFHCALEFLRHLSTAQVSCLKAKDMLQIKLVLTNADMSNGAVQSNQSLKDWSEHCKAAELNVVYAFHDAALVDVANSSDHSGDLPRRRD